MTIEIKVGPPVITISLGEADTSKMFPKSASVR